MSTKGSIIAALEAAHGGWVTGGNLAAALGISRTAIWKGVEAARRDGYRIESVTGRGYRLIAAGDSLSPESIRPHLEHPELAGRIVVLPVLDSTNAEAKRRILAGDTDTAAVFALRQTGGRGRRGRSFFSPPGGIYMSAILRPSLDPEQSVLITTAACVCVCRAIRAVTGYDPEIKWVNDLFLRGKKICGILTEAITDMESGSIGSVVIGIGINYCLNQEEIPAELADIVGSVIPAGEAHPPRGQLAAEILNQLSGLEGMVRAQDFIEEYRARSMVLGRQVRVFTPVEEYDAAAIDIGRDGALEVRTPDGRIVCLRSGEVTIRPKTDSPPKRGKI